MTGRNWTLPEFFSAIAEKNRLVVRLLKDSWATEEEANRLKSALDDLIAQQGPCSIAFDVGHFKSVSAEVIALLVRYRDSAGAVELVNPPKALVDKLGRMNLRQLFTISEE